ncbi:MAG: Pta, partial [Bacteroidetes bacterium]|nr:Pta [Bacteroidota bacterium]
MRRLVVTSMHQNAGKTSIIIGLAKALDMKIGYIKPFGDRLLYRKKRLWDSDAALINDIFGLGQDPAEMSIGFDHSRLLYIFDKIDIHLPKIKQLNINVLGVIPHYEELPKFTVNYLADRLFAKVITGEPYLNRTVKNIIIGSMSASAATKSPVFLEENKVVITGGDRDDMIAAALESSTSAIVLTCNIEPSKELITRATERKIPLLLVTPDTYQIAKQIEVIEPLLQKDDAEKILLIEQIINKHV